MKSRKRECEEEKAISLAILIGFRAHWWERDSEMLFGNAAPKGFDQFCQLLAPSLHYLADMTRSTGGAFPYGRLAQEQGGVGETWKRETEAKKSTGIVHPI